MTRRRRWSIGTALVSLCGAVILVSMFLGRTADGGMARDVPAASQTPSPTAVPTAWPMKVPSGPDDHVPALVVHLPDHDVALRPWTICGFGFGGCADGAPGLAGTLPRLDGGATADFRFLPEVDSITATAVQVDRDCPRWLSASVDDLGSGEYGVHPVGPAGLWRIDVTAARKGEDAHYSFEWRTDTTTAVTTPVDSTLAVLADHDGQLDSYGVELGVNGLAFDLAEVSARVTVTAEDGRSVGIRPTTKQRDTCYQAGSVSLTASEADGRRAAALGGRSFRYDVDLTLDGRTFHGVGQWPEGELSDDEPSVSLRWTPALPAYSVP
ncbi:hypothetical protein [Nocardioides sp. Kera G14]|uniref:hypothetical protein n=1 Tax=Nocardioides sp. Kera G14 TaxID=2884264 RepID=UPI001D12A7F8|nr:hypothetical protein [Nocardioides sp. Kera G14]UDY25127.1 hypothetical protein LH076_07500 [Nocardioides sp. Kera G14]